MPGFDVSVICPESPNDRSRDEQGYYEEAAHLVGNLDAMAAAAMHTVSNGKVNVTGLGWPVTGSTAVRFLSKNRAPIYVTMTMNPLYGGFDFGAHKAELHSVLRGLIWDRLTRLGGVAAPSCDFMLRIEFMVGAGSRVHVSGEVSEEYGGDTNVVKLP